MVHVQAFSTQVVVIKSWVQIIFGFVIHIINRIWRWTTAMKILHKVLRGETLEQIAQTYGCNVMELMKVNDLTHENLNNVSILNIPKCESNFAVLKNFNKEVLVEVTSDNLNQLKQKCKEVNCELSCASVQQLQEGDKVILLNDQQKNYVVKPLDTLSQIARKFQLSEQELMQKNELKTNRLFIGQRLQV